METIDFNNVTLWAWVIPLTGFVSLSFFHSGKGGNVSGNRLGAGAGRETGRTRQRWAKHESSSWRATVSEAHLITGIPLHLITKNTPAVRIRPSSGSKWYLYCLIYEVASWMQINRLSVSLGVLRPRSSGSHPHIRHLGSLYGGGLSGLFWASLCSSSLCSSWEYFSTPSL